MNLEYSTVYGRFSRAKNPETWNGKMNYLNAPDLVSNGAELGYLSAFYRYMTPIYPNPSVHAVVTQLWEPNSFDEDYNMNYGFGTTINILQGKEECDSNFVSDTDKA